MKTDATKKVIYGTILKRRFQELGENNSIENLTALLHDIRKEGYNVKEIENIAGINNFPKGLPIIRIFESEQYSERKNIYSHIKRNIDYRERLLGY